MNMNLDLLQQKLVAIARANRPGDRVPFAFEKRVTALLASRVGPRNLEGWVRGLWRAAVSCVAVALLCGAWSLFTPAAAPPASPQLTAGATDLSQDFENTLLASVDQGSQTP